MPDLHAVSTPTPYGFREITVAAAHDHLADFAILDVREPDEYTGELGHIETAQLAPLGTVPEVGPTLDRSTPWLLVCKSGGRSGRAAAHLVSLGFTEVYNMTGGMLAWRAAGKVSHR